MRRAKRIESMRGAASDRGMTLVELLVAMIVFSLCMTVAFGAVILVVQKMNDVQQSADAVAELRIAVAQMDRQVRSGNVLFSPAGETTTGCTGDVAANSGTCMRIFTQANGPQKCVQWQVKSDPAATDPAAMLLQTRSWNIDGSNVSTWSTVARDLRLGAANPFALEGASTPYKERLLNVSLEAFDERRGETIEVSTSLSGRNTSYGYNASQCTPVP